MKTLRTLSLMLVFGLLKPSPLLACAACYGRTDSPLAEGMNWGILTLLGVVLTVLSGIVVFFVHVIRRETPVDPPPPGQPTDV